MQRTASPGQISNVQPRSRQYTEQADAKHPRPKRRKLGARDQRLGKLDDPEIPDKSDRDPQTSPSHPPDKNGEFKWILGVPAVKGSGAGDPGKSIFQVSNTGFSDIDSRFVPMPTEGRRSFGNFNRQIEVGDESKSLTLMVSHLTNPVLNMECNAAPTAQKQSLPARRQQKHPIIEVSRSCRLESFRNDFVFWLGPTHRTKSGQESLGSFK